MTIYLLLFQPCDSNHSNWFFTNLRIVLTCELVTPHLPPCQSCDHVGEMIQFYVYKILNLY